jgi:hypothetical protein
MEARFAQSGRVEKIAQANPIIFIESDSNCFASKTKTVVSVNFPHASLEREFCRELLVNPRRIQQGINPRLNPPFVKELKTGASGELFQIRTSAQRKRASPRPDPSPI